MTTSRAFGRVPGRATGAGSGLAAGRAAGAAGGGGGGGGGSAWVGGTPWAAWPLVESSAPQYWQKRIELTFDPLHLWQMMRPSAGLEVGAMSTTGAPARLGSPAGGGESPGSGSGLPHSVQKR